MSISMAGRPLAAVAMCTCLLAGALTTTSAQATGGVPIQGTEVGLDHDPEGIVVSGASDANGKVVFADLKPGHYTVVIAGKSLAAAMSGTRAPRSETSDSHATLQLGVGDWFGGSSRSSGRDDAGPAKRGASSGSGLGIGFSVPLGGGEDEGSPALRKKKDKDWDEAVGDRMIDISWGTTDGTGQTRSRNSLALPYCPEAAGDIRVGVDLPHVGAVVIEIDQQGRQD